MSDVVIKTKIYVLSPGKGVAYCERCGHTERPGKRVAYCEWCDDTEINTRFIAREKSSIL